MIVPKLEEILRVEKRTSEEVSVEAFDERPDQGPNPDA